MISLYLLRHAHSVANSLDLVNGHLDDPLTEEGRFQAKESGRLIKKFGIHFDYFFTSHWQRAKETAALAFPEIEFNVDTRLGETDPGEAAEIRFAELPIRYPEFYQPFSPTRPYPGGESHQQLYDRSIEWFEEMNNMIKKKANILVISHGGPICCILQYICKVPMRFFPMFVSANASLSLITKKNSSNWALNYFSLPCFKEIMKL